MRVKDRFCGIEQSKNGSEGAVWGGEINEKIQPKKTAPKGPFGGGKYKNTAKKNGSAEAGPF